jgi:SAM-dependent methyltransferase
MIKRDKCVFCGDIQLIPFREISMPVSMSCLDKPVVDDFEVLQFCFCRKCETIQLGYLAEPYRVYMVNLNYTTVGETWKTHMEAFSEFIKKHNPKNVLEIGSPTGELFSKVNNESLEHWTIYEQTPSPNAIISDKLTIKHSYFDTSTLIKEKVDTVVFSHVLEHLYQPREILEKLYDILPENGQIILSFPNMEYIADHDLMPPYNMHFEHTYYLTQSGLEAMIANTGFRIVNLIHHKNHAIFVAAQKANKLNLPAPFNRSAISRLYTFFDNIQKDMREVNQKIKGKKEVYLYAAHSASQYLLQSGLQMFNIQAFLDNSKLKQGKFLYGYTFPIYNPECIKDNINPIVICRMGIYNQEIINKLKSINPQVEII